MGKEMMEQGIDIFSMSYYEKRHLRHYLSDEIYDILWEKQYWSYVHGGPPKARHEDCRMFTFCKLKQKGECSIFCHNKISKNTTMEKAEEEAKRNT